MRARVLHFLKSCLRTRLVGWIFIAFILLVWEVLGRLGNPMLPALSGIWNVWLEDYRDGVLAEAIWQTLFTVLYGFAIAAVIGTVIGFFMGRFKWVWIVLEPVTEWLRLTPVTAVIPLIVFFLGIGYKVHVFVVAFAATFPVLINAMAGAQSLPKTQEETARTFQLGWWRSILFVAVPNALPFIMVGLRQALGTSMLLAVVAGIMAGHGGIGYYILSAQVNYDNVRLFAGLWTAALMGYGLNSLFLLIQNKVDMRGTRGA